MVLLDLLGRRWTLRVLWELRAERLTFRELRGRCDAVSPSVLNARLAELREARIVESAPGDGYGLSREGHALLRALSPLNGFATRWAAPAPRPRASAAHPSRARRRRPSSGA